MNSPDPGEQGPNRVQVVVRVRPVLPHELTDDVAITCSPDARKLQVLLPDRLSGGTSVLPGATRTGARSYEFDACLPGGTTQEELYDVCGLQELVEAALDGYCVTVFAFGQTGSGKTHTIIGPRLSRGAGAASGTTRLVPGGAGSSIGGAGTVPGDDFAGGGSPSAPGTAPGLGGGGGGLMAVDPEDGILTRCISAAYRSIEARAGSAEFAVSASVVELYNEAVTDLLALDKTKQLQVRKDARDGFAVTGLTQVSCPSDVAAVRYMVRALQYRHTRGHKLNEYSSRSHCLMTFVFASKEAGPDGQTGAKGGIRRYGKLALVDLAGSERLKDTGNTERGAVRETGAINKSLFTLGQVLAGLSARSSGSPNAFVPFRDSKLTQLLWDGLRGTGRCLMLACVGPMRGSVEESLNTLHFATMATRIKAEPVVLLDPQDQLVLDLRKTITQLREENRHLAGALQQLSQGVDPAAVLAALPDAIRSHAGTGGGATPDGRPVATPPGGSSESSAPTTPLRPLQHHLQPLPGPSGRPRQSYDASGGGGGGGAVTPEHGGEYGGGYGQSPAPGQGQRMSSSELRASYGSSVGGYGGGGGAAAPGAYRANGGMSVEVTSPSYAAGGAGGARSGGPRHSQQQGRASNGAGGRTPSPLAAMYGVSPTRSSPSGARNGRKPGGKGASPRDGGGGGGGNRSRSVGRGGARPAYLTEDPGALLFGYSNALPPPGSGSGSGVSLPALGPGRGAGAGGGAERGMAPPPVPALSEFPELAAMEAEFQSMMANGGGAAPGVAGGAGAQRQGGGSTGSGAGAGYRASAGSGTGTGGTGGGDSSEVGDGGGPRPDVRALKWAERNSWFGTDYDMTAFAYEIHDRLVDVEHVDPTSDLYYMEIERRVAERFPDKWARVMRDQLPGGSGAAAAAGIRRAAGDPRGPPLQVAAAAAAPQQQASYSAALRVNVKEPTFTRTPSGGSGSGGSGPSAASMAASLAAQAAQAAARSRQQPYQPGGGSLGASYDSGSYEYGELQLSSVYDGGGAGGGGPEGNGAVNPFNIGALHAVAPPKASKFAPVPGGGHGMVLVPAGASDPMGRGPNNPFESYPDPNAAERIQKEYARQRAMVVEELRKAKEDAEAERQRILNRIYRAAGGNKWR